MAKKKPVGVWGIDLGQCGLKAIRLEETEAGVTATAFDYVEHPKILSQPDADPDQLTREALEKFLSHNAIKGDVVCISVPGQSGLARFVKLPPVEEKKIGDIVRFEAKQQIPFNLDEVVWDYQKLGAGMVTDGFALDTEIGLFAMKRDAVNKYLQHFRDVSIDVHVVQMAPLALCNYVAYDLLKMDPGQESEEGAKNSAVVALDIGTDASNLVITDGGRIIWQRPIPLGGNHFTRALTKDLKLTFAKAEHLKRNAMKSPELKKILASIKPVLTDFVSEVQRSLGYFTNTHRDVQIQYMVGLGNAFRLPGMQRFLAEKLQLDVRKMEKLNRLSGAAISAPLFSENILSFGVAYGLAVQGLQKARLLTNLLPPEIKMERLIKAKKPWAAAAAAILLLSVGALAFGYGRQYAAFTGKDIDDARKRGAGVLNKVSAANTAYDAAVKASNEEKEKVEGIVGGVKEQLNWLQLSQFIDDAVPRPECIFRGGLPLDVVSNQTRYDEAMQALRDNAKRLAYCEACDLPPPAEQYLRTAVEAYAREYAPWKRGAGSELSDRDSLPDGLRGVINFNIEAINTRYAGKLADFWKKLPSDVREKRGFCLPEADAQKPPADGESGWVVELRGYTYHQDGSNFVLNVLLQNLARKAVEKGDWVTKTPPPAETTPTTPGTPAPGTPPAPTTPAPGAGQPAATPPRQVTHVMLLNSKQLPADGSTPFEIIKSSKLGDYVSNDAPQQSGGGSGGMGMAGMAGPAGGGSGAPPGTGGGGQTGGGKDDWKPLGSDALEPPLPKSDSKKGGAVHNYQRTEFVILFIWREQTPTDHVKPKAGAPAGGGSGMGGAPGMPGLR